MRIQWVDEATRVRYEDAVNLFLGDDKLQVTVKNGILELVHPMFRATHNVSHNKDFWEDNGFSSLGAMLDAHERILNRLPVGPINTVMDLGAGNGHLLHLVSTHYKCFGIALECSQARCDAGRMRYPLLSWHCQDIRTATSLHADLVLISYERFVEGLSKDIANLANKFLMVSTYDGKDVEFSEFDGFTRGYSDGQLVVYVRDAK